MTSNIFFILVAPAVPENIGAAARAIKTMGFSKLRLVNPCDHLCEKARTLAHASNDILENAEVFNSLQNALHDIDFAVATSAKIRNIKNDYYPCNDLPELLLNKKNAIHNIAIVFGCEESGLTNSEIQLCDIISYIPLKNKYPSLNLAQAVMVYAYSLSSLLFKPHKKINKKPNEAKYQVLKKIILKIMDDYNISENPLIANRIMERIAIINDDDINLLYSVCNKLLKNKN